jgi:hypothetical protein
MLTSIATLVILFYLREYHLSTFIQLNAVYPQLHSGLMHLCTAVLKWFNMEVNTTMVGKRREVLFTKEELKKYADASKGLYLAILGKVYDVGKGEKFYGHTGKYHFFTGV